jgi:hypothetical protein
MKRGIPASGFLRKLHGFHKIDKYAQFVRMGKPGAISIAERKWRAL